MIRTILSVILFFVIGLTLARNRIYPEKASYWVIIGCAIAIELVYYFD